MFLEYLFYLSKLILNLSRLMLPIITLIYAVVILFQSMFRRQNNKYNVDSASVQLVRWIYKYALLPVCRFLRDLWRFARSKRYVFIASLMWAFYFNFFTILVEAFAYYLYFCVSFDFLHLYIQVYKLLLDPVPWGRTTVPRTCWSAWRGSTPRRMDSSMVSSNLALAVCLTSSMASAGS